MFTAITNLLRVTTLSLALITADAGWAYPVKIALIILACMSWGVTCYIEGMKWDDSL